MARAGVIAGAALMLLAACGGTAGSTSAGVNVTGVLDRGPVATCPADEPCDPPPGISALIFSAAGGAQTRVPVGGDGHFSAHLVPGRYAIEAAPPPFGGRIDPATVDVPETGTVFLQLHVARPS